MTFKLNLLPVPRVADAALREYLERERALLLFLVGKLNDIGCGLYFPEDGKLAVKLADESIVCDDGLSVDPSAIDHGGLGGLDADDHPQYVSLAPDGDRNQMLIGEPNTTGIEITAPAAYAGKYLHGLDSTLAQTFAVEADGKGEFNDIDEGFADPNSHFQASNTSLKARMEELGFVLKETTRYWDLNGNPRWAGSTAPGLRAALRTWAVACPDAATTTVLGGEILIPTWYAAVGSDIVYAEIEWAVEVAPGADRNWMLRLSTSTYDPGELIPAITNQDQLVPIPSGITLNQIQLTTVAVTAAFGAGDTRLHFELHRVGGGAGDDYTASVYVTNVRLKSGVKST